MAKRRRRVQVQAPARPPRRVTQSDVASPQAGWRWRTFPVFFAFVCGMLVAALANRETDSTLELVVMLAAVFGVGYGVAHLFVTNVIVAGRVRRRELEQRRGARDDDEYEDVIVHPEENREQR